VSVDDLSVALKQQLAADCNPVVWATFVQEGRDRALRETAIASGIYNQTAYAMNNQCLIKIGPNGEDVSDVHAKIMAQTEAALNVIESAICTLNWGALFNGFLGINISFCRGGQLIGGGIQGVLNSTFLRLAHDITQAKDCIQARDINANIMQQMGGTFGTDVLMGGVLSSFDPTLGGARGSGGIGFSFGGIAGFTTGSTGSTDGNSIGATVSNPTTGPVVPPGITSQVPAKPTWPPKGAIQPPAWATAPIPTGGSAASLGPITVPTLSGMGAAGSTAGAPISVQPTSAPLSAQQQAQQSSQSGQAAQQAAQQAQQKAAQGAGQTGQSGAGENSSGQPGTAGRQWKTPSAGDANIYR
jgi:hypothetical protein